MPKHGNPPEAQLQPAASPIPFYRPVTLQPHKDLIKNEWMDLAKALGEYSPKLKELQQKIERAEKAKAPERAEAYSLLLTKEDILAFESFTPEQQKNWRQGMKDAGLDPLPSDRLDVFLQLHHWNGIRYEREHKKFGDQIANVHDRLSNPENEEDPMEVYGEIAAASLKDTPEGSSNAFLLARKLYQSRAMLAAEKLVRGDRDTNKRQNLVNDAVAEVTNAFIDGATAHLAPTVQGSALTRHTKNGIIRGSLDKVSDLKIADKLQVLKTALPQAIIRIAEEQGREAAELYLEYLKNPATLIDGVAIFRGRFAVALQMAENALYTLSIREERSDTENAKEVAARINNLVGAFVRSKGDDLLSMTSEEQVAELEAGPLQGFLAQLTDEGLEISQAQLGSDATDRLFTLLGDSARNVEVRRGMVHARDIEEIIDNQLWSEREVQEELDKIPMSQPERRIADEAVNERFNGSPGAQGYIIDNVIDTVWGNKAHFEDLPMSEQEHWRKEINKHVYNNTMGNDLSKRPGQDELSSQIIGLITGNDRFAQQDARTGNLIDLARAFKPFQEAVEASAREAQNVAIELWKSSGVGMTADDIAAKRYIERSEKRAQQMWEAMFTDWLKIHSETDSTFRYQKGLVGRFMTETAPYDEIIDDAIAQRNEEHDGIDLPGHVRNLTNIISTFNPGGTSTPAVDRRHAAVIAMKPSSEYDPTKHRGNADTGLSFFDSFGPLGWLGKVAVGAKGISGRLTFFPVDAPAWLGGTTMFEHLEIATREALNGYSITFGSIPGLLTVEPEETAEHALFRLLNYNSLNALPDIGMVDQQKTEPYALSSTMVQMAVGILGPDMWNADNTPKDQTRLINEYAAIAQIRGFTEDEWTTQITREGIPFSTLFKKGPLSGEYTEQINIAEVAIAFKDLEHINIEHQRWKDADPTLKHLTMMGRVLEMVGVANENRSNADGMYIAKQIEVYRRRGAASKDFIEMNTDDDRHRESMVIALQQRFGSHQIGWREMIKQWR